MLPHAHEEVESQPCRQRTRAFGLCMLTEVEKERVALGHARYLRSESAGANPGIVYPPSSIASTPKKGGL